MQKIDYNNYKRPSDFINLEIGDNQIRIVSDGLLAYKHDLKTGSKYINLGLCTETTDCKSCKSGYEPKKVWRWVAYDYSTGRVGIMDCGPMLGNQISMIGFEPKDADILIHRVGSKLSTTYSAKKAPEQKEIPEEIKRSIVFEKRRLISKYFKAS